MQRALNPQTGRRDSQRLPQAARLRNAFRHRFGYQLHFPFSLYRRFVAEPPVRDFHSFHPLSAPSKRATENNHN